MTMRTRLLIFLGLVMLTRAVFADATYIRADFAYSWGWDQSGQTVTATSPASTSAIDMDVDGVPEGQLGFGYFLDPYVRFDITGLLGGNRRVNTHCSSTPSACVPGAKGDFTVTTSALFANAYYELASLWAKKPTVWHPYLGIGLGSAHHYMSDWDSTFTVGGVPTNASVDGHGQWQFAWRGTAGLAVTIADNLLLDVAYVYMDAGQASGGEKTFVGTNPSPVYLQKSLQMDMKTQEAYIGLRHQF